MGLLSTTLAHGFSWLLTHPLAPGELPAIRKLHNAWQFGICLCTEGEWVYAAIDDVTLKRLATVEFVTCSFWQA